MTIRHKNLRKPVISVPVEHVASTSRFGRNSPPFLTLFARLGIELRQCPTVTSATRNPRPSRLALQPPCEIDWTIPLPAMEK